MHFWKESVIQNVFQHNEIIVGWKARHSAQRVYRIYSATTKQFYTDKFGPNAKRQMQPPQKKQTNKQTKN